MVIIKMLDGCESLVQWVCFQTLWGSSLPLSHKFRIDLPKRSIWILISCKLELIFFAFLTFMSVLLHQSQTRYARNLDNEFWIKTYHRVLHRLELRYFLLARFSLNARQASLTLEKWKGENFRITACDISFLWLFIHYVLVTMALGAASTNVHSSQLQNHWWKICLEANYRQLRCGDVIITGNVQR